MLTHLKYFLSQAVYNLSLHPLAKYKGPLLWRAFRFPFVYSMINGDLPQRVRQFHDQYGGIVRVGPNELSFTDPISWKDIYLRNFIRPYEYRSAPPGKDAPNLITASESDHSRFRKVMAPAFSSTPEQETVVNTYVDLMIHKLHDIIRDDTSGNSAVVDVLKWFNLTTFDIIGHLLWGCSFGCLEEERYHPWLQVISQFKAATIARAAKFYPPLEKVLTAITPKAAKAGLMEIWRTVEIKTFQRLEKGSLHADMISHMASPQGSSSSRNHQMSLAELEVNSMLIVVAGSESVTTALTGIINYLLRNPSQLRALTHEVRSTFQDEKDMTGTSISRVPYLDAVLHEGLRLCPTIPDGMRRLVPHGGAIVAGQFLPEGTVVSIPQWAAYQSADNFFSPSVFAPERWLTGSSTSYYKTDCKDAFQPFSLGQHNCPGKSIAYLEMRLMLAKMVWNFDLEPVKGYDLPQWDKQKIYWFWDKQSVCARIRSAR